MKIVPEIDLSPEEHKAICSLRNEAFPDHSVPRSYYKQLPHYRCLEYQGKALIGHMGLDYRVIGVDGDEHRVLAIVDFCIKSESRRSGVGSSMLSSLGRYATEKAVDAIILISDLDDFYVKNGFRKTPSFQSWLRLNKFRNYGVAHEFVGDFFVKSISGKPWREGHVDWMGYMC